MSFRKFAPLLAAIAGVNGSAAHAVNLVVNGGFENPTLPLASPTYCTSLPCNELLPPASVPPWQSSSDIEIWTSGFLGVPAYQGNQFNEVNSSGAPPLFQVISGIAVGTPLSYSFAHRGRNGSDVLKLKITDVVTSSVLFDQNFTTGNAAWSLYTAPSPVFATGNALKLEFIPVSPLVGSGNFLDAVQLNAPDPSRVPGPLPLVGVGAMVGFSRQLRQRIKLTR